MIRDQIHTNGNRISIFYYPDCLSVFLSKRKGAHESNKWRKKENIQKEIEFKNDKN